MKPVIRFNADGTLHEDQNRLMGTMKFKLMLWYALNEAPKIEGNISNAARLMRDFYWAN